MGAIAKALGKKPPADDEQRLAAIVAAYRAAPCAELVALASSVPAPAFEGDTTAWLKAARSTKPSQLGRSSLVAAIRGKRIADTQKRFAAAIAWGPDPRTTRALELVVTEAPYTGDASWDLWATIMNGVRKSNDARFKPLAASLPPSWGMRENMTKTLADAFADAVKKIGEPAKLDAADRAAIEAWQAALPKQAAPDGNEESLRAAIFANLDDDAPRSVYADWLVARGEKRGELIQLQLAGKEDQAKQLLKKHWEACVGPLAPVITKQAELRRGFVVKATARFKHDKQLREFGALPDWATIEELAWPGDDFDGPAVRHAKKISGVWASMILAARQPFPYEELTVFVDDLDEFRAILATKLLPKLRVLRVQPWQQRISAAWHAIKDSAAKQLRVELINEDGEPDVPAAAAVSQTGGLTADDIPFRAAAWTDEGWWLADVERLLLVDPASRKILREHAINEADHSAFSTDGKLAVCAGWEVCHLYSLETGAVVRKLRIEAPVRSFAVSRDARFILVGLERHAHLYDTASRKQLREVKARYTYSAGIAPDGSRIAVPNDYFDEKRINDLHIFEPKKGGRALKLGVDADDPRFLPDGRLICTIADSLVIYSATGEKLQAIKGSSKLLHAPLPSPDGTRVVAWAEPNALLLFDLGTGKAKRVAQGEYYETPFAWSPDGKQLLIGTSEPRVINL
jgi:uncharacterized protein (TIGR02996 family)